MGTQKNSQWDGPFEHPKHMFKLMDKKILKILRKQNFLIWIFVLWSTHNIICFNWEIRKTTLKYTLIWIPVVILCKELWLQGLQQDKTATSLHTDLQIRVGIGKLLSFSSKTYVVDTQKNRLNETVLLSTKNICLNRWIRKYLQFYPQKFCLSMPMCNLALETLTSWFVTR